MHDITIRAMTRPELDLAVSWAAREGWNPGLHDADAFWAADPEGFLVAEHQGEVVGTGSAVSYDGLYGFIGFFIVRPDCRHLGAGLPLGAALIQHLRTRLRPDAVIGLDGVFSAQAAYAHSGFIFSGRDLRFEGRGEKFPRPRAIVPASRVPLNDIAAFDAAHFPAPRRRFLENWLKLPESAAFAAVPTGLGWFKKKKHTDPSLPLPRLATGLDGYAVVRRCQKGFKIGPLFARHESVAEDLFRACSTHAAGEPLFLDVPEANGPGLALAARHGMKECFGCARMYSGPVPAHNQSGVFGLTTFELG